MLKSDNIPTWRAGRGARPQILLARTGAGAFRGPYHRARTSEEALEEIQKVAGSQLDPMLVEVFLSLVDPDSKTARKSPDAGARDAEDDTTAPVGWMPETGVA